jgi:hypothetical protein
MEELIDESIAQIVEICKKIASVVEEDYTTTEIVIYGLNSKFFSGKGIHLAAGYEKDINPKTLTHWEARDIKKYTVGASNIKYFTSGNTTPSQLGKQLDSMAASNGPDRDLKNILKMKKVPNKLKEFGIKTNGNVYICGSNKNLSCNPDGVFSWNGVLCPVEVKCKNTLHKLEREIVQQTFRNKKGDDKVSLEEAKKRFIQKKSLGRASGDNKSSDEKYDPRKDKKKKKMKVKYNLPAKEEPKATKRKPSVVPKPDSAFSLCDGSVLSNHLLGVKGHFRSKSQSRYSFHNSTFDFEDRVPQKIITAHMRQLKTQMYLMKAPVCLLIYRDDESVYYSLIPRPPGLCESYLDIHKNVKEFFDRNVKPCV